MARQRQVFPTDEVPHKWAHQAQDEARNPQGNLYFRGATLYSYRDSYPIARIYKKRAATLVLVNSERYSVTTASHISAAERAAQHLPRVRVPYVVIDDRYSMKDAHAENIKYLTEQAAALLARAQRSLRAGQVEWRSENARRLIDDTRSYMAFFGIRRKQPEFPQTEWAAAMQRAERIESPDPVKDARKFKAKAKRQAAARAALQAQFDKYAAAVQAYNDAQRIAREGQPDAAQYWRENGTWPKAPDVDAQRPYAGYKMMRKFQQAGFEVPTVDYSDGRPDQVLLRVAGDEIVTSMGARVPLAAAPMVWAMVQRARRSENGLAPSRIGLSRGPMIGNYPLDRIDADGTLHAGCHTIPYSELAMMARALGLAS